jgi:hypothetical protein
LHLLRFVYDTDTMMKKKLFDEISFPTTFKHDSMTLHL